MTDAGGPRERIIGDRIPGRATIIHPHIARIAAEVSRCTRTTGNSHRRWRNVGKIGWNAGLIVRYTNAGIPCKTIQGIIKQTLPTENPVNVVDASYSPDAAHGSGVYPCPGLATVAGVEKSVGNRIIHSNITHQWRIPESTAYIIVLRQANIAGGKNIPDSDVI